MTAGYLRDHPSLLVVEAVAEESGTPPDELPPLYDTVDPERLDAIVGGAEDDPHRRVEFTYSGFHVTVEGSDVTVSSVD